MNLEEMRKRLAEIVNLISELGEVENYSDENITNVNALNDEYLGLKAKIETGEKVAAMKADILKSEPKVSKTVARIEVKAPKANGFKSAGEFFMSVKKAAHGNIDERFTNTAYEKYGEDGGFLVPEEFMSEIQKKMEGDESLLAKTKQYRLNGNSLTLPIDENNPWNGGVVGYWIGEGEQYTESKPKFAQWSERLAKVGALVKASEELLEDAAAMESHIKTNAPEAILQKVNEAIIAGDGVMKPTGILSSGFRVVVAKENAQSADTILAANVIKMYSRMLPKSRVKSAWYINAGIEEELRLLKDANGNYIYLAPGSQMNQTPYGVLLGRPVIPMLGSMPALGDEGDIVFADLSYFYSILKVSGIKNTMSTHLYFDRDITAFKFTLRMNGSVPFKTPVTTQYGAYEMSGIITLEAR